MCEHLGITLIKRRDVFLQHHLLNEHVEFLLLLLVFQELKVKNQIKSVLTHKVFLMCDRLDCVFGQIQFSGLCDILSNDLYRAVYYLSFFIGLEVKGELKLFNNVDQMGVHLII